MSGKRKYLSEFSVTITSERWLMFTPEQLHAEGVMRAEHKDIADNCHIYMICKRPKATCSSEPPIIDNGIMTGFLTSRVDGKELISSYKLPFQFEDEEEKIVVAEYPHRKIYTVNNQGEGVRYWPGDFLAFHTGNRIFKDLEVLYIGQAYAEGKRTALDRLRSHSTLQKILADTMYNFPDDQVFIIAVEYDDYFIASMFNRMEEGVISGEEDDIRLKSVFENPLSQKEIICLSEAGLIRYFKPKYNKIYRDNFPAADQSVLSGCFDLDFSGLSVEIELYDTGLRLFSDSASAQHHHIAMFNLVDETERLGFFTFSDGVNAPFTVDGTILMKK
ncbi:hypothetical protein NB069_08590 [Leclercia adecarboxylata]|uniref:hypothetical protein n=1 Tax=Leclercia adecarboxylata TaxID=83655 RepID=UPI00202A0E38|nr:hypothetical protein [Leclercia adecarboxylata]URO00912.1 hypothetical protein NB069_08590 [Leclercia adecarboxylata]